MNERPSTEIGAVLSHVAETLEGAGYTARVVSQPDSPYDGVVATVPLGNGREREAVVTPEAPHLGLYLTHPHPSSARNTPSLGPENAYRVTIYSASTDVGPHLVEGLAKAVQLGRADDPDASPEEIRTALRLIADRERNAGSLGNVRGPDLASLATVALRLLDAVERLSNRAPSV